MKIEVTMQLRPCIDIEDNERLLFHHWWGEDVAICEKEDGTMTMRGMRRIKFLDNMHKEYAFTNNQNEKSGEQNAR